ncbi:MAG TPA: copper chaperone PCu(A)C [Candidatus Omnitrophota bacterium]|nr:copper chaperone PCu(A)C [Candidatus Omnitrophota bacterium]
MKSVVGIALAAVLALSVQPALAGDAAKGDIAVKGAWSRATPPQAPAGGAFMTITNSGKQDDKLVAAKAGVSKTVELHTHVNDNGVMRMRQVEAIPVAAGQTVALQPGGLHVMFIGLNAPLQQGQAIPVTLVFEKAGEVAVSVDVQQVGAMGPAAMMHDPAMHQQHMADPAMQKMHEQHMQDPAMRQMHDKMHGAK